MEKCPCCLRIASEFFNNHRDRKGTLYCKFCKDAYDSKNIQYFKILREVRKRERHAIRIQKGTLTCRICKTQKLFENFIRNKSKTLGYDNRCKDCDKIVKKERVLRLGDKVAEYHNSYNKAHKEDLKKNFKKYYERTSKNLEDGYVLMALRGDFRARGIYLQTSEIPQELIEAKRISLGFKRQLKTLKELENEECKPVAA